MTECRMVHPAWREFLPKLRALLDERGLTHVVIVQDPDEHPGTYAERVEWLGREVETDELITFEAADPDWRSYRVEFVFPDENPDARKWAERGLARYPADHWLKEARRIDDTDAPMVLHKHGKWQMSLGFSDPWLDEDALFAKLLPYLEDRFADGVFVLEVAALFGDRFALRRKPTTSGRSPG